MNRRSLIKHAVALLGIPSGVVGGAALAQAVVLPDPNLTPASVPADGPSPCPWLEQWLRLPMRPLVSQIDLEDCHDPRVRNLASRILARPSGGEALVFRYLGGSDSGTVRTVLPVMLFRKFDPDAQAGLTADDRVDGPVYLLAHCQTREAPRTFRLDRMEWVAG